MISMAAIPAADRAGGQASSSRLAQAAKALSSASSAAESGVVVAIAVLVLLVTGASDQRRRLRSAAEDIFFRVLQSLLLEGRFGRSDAVKFAPYDAVTLTIDAPRAMLQTAVRAPAKSMPCS